MDAYEQLISRIVNSSGIKQEEIERKIEAKRAKLSGLISKEGAAQIIAAELGISFDNGRVKISDLMDGMKRVHVSGVITQIFPIKNYHKNNRQGKIGSFLFGDENSNIRVVLWDMHHIELLEKNELKEGDSVEIINGSVRNNELHLGSFSDLKKSTEKFKEVKKSRTLITTQIKNARVGIYAKIRATIVQFFEPRVFDDKSNPGIKRLIVNVVLDDGTETIRAVMSSEQLLQFGFDKNSIFDADFFLKNKDFILGEERFFIGSYRMNSYFNKIEMSVEEVEKINAELLLKELESSLNK